MRANTAPTAVTHGLTVTPTNTHKDAYKVDLGTFLFENIVGILWICSSQEALSLPLIRLSSPRSPPTPEATADDQSALPVEAALPTTKLSPSRGGVISCGIRENGH